MSNELTGIALREAVATRVMGMTGVFMAGVLNPAPVFDNGMTIQVVPAYEESIAAAWLAVEAMRAKGYTFQVGFSGHSEPAWWAEFADTERITEQGAPTAPEAICRAALAALKEAHDA